MKVAGQTYGYYFTREFLPPLIFFILCTLLSLLLIPVQLMLKRSLKAKHHCITQFLLEHVFNTTLNKHTDRSGQKVYTILNYEVPDRYKIFMLAMVLSVIGYTGVVFWDSFFFEKSHICSTDPGLACFPKYPNMTTPRLDCSNTSCLEDNNITSIICYRHAFRLSTATGSALGLVASYALYITIINLLILKVSNGSGWNKHRAVLTVVIQITIVTVTVSATIVIYYYLTTIYYTYEKQVIMIITNGFLTFTIAYNIVLFPWWSFKKVKGDENYNKEDDTEKNGDYRKITGTSIPI